MRKYEINTALETEQARRDYIGRTFVSEHYGEFKVLGAYDRYIQKNNNKLRFVVEFTDTKFQTIAFANRIKSGQIKDYMVPWIQGIGYVGDCSFEDEPSKHFLYKHWIGIFDRCYNEKSKEYRPKGSIDKRWHCFLTFVEDSKTILGYDEIAIRDKKLRTSIDKDFIIQGNQMYSKETCCFIPHKINTFLMNKNKNNVNRKEKARKYNYEGVYVAIEGTTLFSSSMAVNNKTRKIKSSRCPFECHKAFWAAKLKIAHQYIEEDFPFISEDLRRVIYNKVKLKEQMSLLELDRAVADGYFEKEYGIKVKPR